MNKKITQMLIYVLVVVAFVLIINFAIRYDYNKTKDQVTKMNVSENLFDKNENSFDKNEDLIIKNGDVMDEEKTIVVVETNKGKIILELNAEKAPISVKNFLKYVNNEFYNGTVFHRVIKEFMIQGGGFMPSGEQKETLESIMLESNNGLKNLKGTVAMARTNDPDSATSQFFINTVDNDFLDYSSQSDGYAVFGKVIEGLDIVLEIENVSTSTNNGMQDWPTEDVIIEDVYLQ
jgi:cyclophilin family peptidyl-prolyl cis-trans isomerase